MSAKPELVGNSTVLETVCPRCSNLTESLACTKVLVYPYKESSFTELRTSVALTLLRECCPTRKMLVSFYHGLLLR